MAAGLQPERISSWMDTLRASPVALAVMVGAYAVGILGAAIFATQPATYPGFVACALASSGLIVVLWWRDGLTMRQVLIGAVVARLVFFPLLPSLSDDAFRYVWDGLIQVQGFNPYHYLPTDEALAPYQDRAVFEALNSAAYYSVYPPLSQVIFAIGGGFSGLGWQAAYYVIKGVFVLIELGGVWALAQMGTPRMVLVYSWQPLVLVETAGQAHTEAAMVGFLFLTVWAVRDRKAHWAGAALAGAGMVKLYPFVLFPFVWRRLGWRPVLTGSGVAALLTVPYASPEALTNLLSSLRLYVQLFEFNAGPYFALKEAFALATGQDWSKQLGPALALIFAAGLLVLYRVDARANWRFKRVSIFALGAYLILSTTVHPWYLLSVGALAALFQPPSWHWIWLGAASMGTYLFYANGPYWTFVVLGWTGLTVIAIIKHSQTVRQWVQKKRALGKADRLARHVMPITREAGSPLRVLDLGAGEGYVGAQLQKRFDADVQLADVVNLNQTALPHVEYDGHRLPFDDDAFDIVILYFVLHHAETPVDVLRESLRVSRSRVMIVESVCVSSVQCRLLRWLDIAANRVRGGAKMAAQEVHLEFRTASEWERLAEDLGASVHYQERFGNWVHPQVLLALRPGSTPS